MYVCHTCIHSHLLVCLHMHLYIYIYIFLFLFYICVGLCGSHLSSAFRTSRAPAGNRGRPCQERRRRDGAGCWWVAGARAGGQVDNGRAIVQAGKVASGRVRRRAAGIGLAGSRRRAGGGQAAGGRAGERRANARRDSAAGGERRGWVGGGVGRQAGWLARGQAGAWQRASSPLAFQSQWPP